MSSSPAARLVSVRKRQRLRCSEVVVRGGVEPPTFHFSGGNLPLQERRQEARISALTCDKRLWKSVKDAFGCARWDQFGPQVGPDGTR